MYLEIMIISIGIVANIVNYPTIFVSPVVLHFTFDANVISSLGKRRSMAMYRGKKAKKHGARSDPAPCFPAVGTN